MTTRDDDPVHTAPPERSAPRRQPRRDDDPVHPNFSGLRFQATTGHDGIVAMPEFGNGFPALSYLTVDEAMELAGDLGELIQHLETTDSASYAAAFFGLILDDLRAATAQCVEEPKP